MTGNDLAGGSHPVKRRLLSMVVVTAAGFILAAAGFAWLSILDARTSRDIVEVHLPARTAGNRLLLAIEQVGVAFAASSLQARTPENEAQFLNTVSTQFKIASAAGRELLAVYDGHPELGLARERQRLARALDELQRIEAGSGGNLRGVAEALSLQPPYVSTVALQLVRLHMHVTDELLAAKQWRDDLLWKLFAALGLVLVLAIVWLVRRNLRDVEAMLLSEEALTRSLDESERIFRTAFDSSPQGMALSRADGQMFRVNPALCAMLGYASDELGQRNLLALIHPDDRTRHEALLRDTIAGTIPGYVDECRYCRKSGEVIWVRGVSAPWRDGRGAIAGVLSQLTDITESRRVAEALRLSEETFARAEQITHIGAWDWDIASDGVRWSDELYRILGLAPRSLPVGPASLLERVHPADRPSVGEGIEAAVAEPAQVYSVQYRVLRPDGSARTVHERATVYRDAGGRPLRMVGTVHDISEQQSMEQRLRTALREKELLLKEIYHRVKNNLQVVSSLLVLQSNNTQDAAARAMLEDSANRVKSMALVHEQLYQSGDLVRIAFATYVNQLIAHLKETYGHDGGVSLRTDIEDVELGIETAVPLGLIINELISNAYKHAFSDAGARGEIRLRLRHLDDGFLELSVTDAGKGLPADFNPRRSRSLGMRLVVSLTEQLEGTFSFGPGEAGGTRFAVRFRPALQEEDRLRDDQPAQAPQKE